MPIFDLIIFTTIISLSFLLYKLCIGIWRVRFFKKSKSRFYNKKIFYATTFFISTSLLTLIYGSFIEPRILIVSTHNISLDPEADNHIANIALVSDQHLGYFKKSTFTKKLAKKLLALNPDIILLDGDFLSGNPQAGLYLSELKPATSKIQSYAIFGNHDYNVGYRDETPRDDTKFIRKVFQEIGVTILENEHKLIKTPTDEFWLIGSDDVIANRDEIAKAFNGLSPNDTRVKVLLSHNPDILFPVTRYRIPIDLVLAGHTHGGQVRLPIIGSLAHLPIYLPQSYDKGLFDYKGYPIIITAGVGETGTRARLFNPPEITMIKLSNKKR